MRAITSKDGDLLPQFDNINEERGANEAATADIIRNASLKKIPNNNNQAANKGKTKRQLPLEHIFGFCKTITKITKNLEFHSTFKTAKLQDIIFTTIGDNSNVTLNSLYLYVLFLIPSSETQLMFIKSIQKIYWASFDDWYSERKLVTDTLYQVDIRSAQSMNSSKYLISAHQKADRLNAPNKSENISIN